MLAAGKRDRYITVEKGTSVQDPGTGEPTFTWATYFQCWAERKDLAGREGFQAQQIAAMVDIIYRIPYPYGKPITTHEGLRVVDQGQTFNITKVPELGKRGREGLELWATARSDEPV